MGVGFYLTGTYDAIGANDTDAWLDEIVSWFEDQAADVLEGCRKGHNHDEQPAAFATLHPAAEDVEIIIPEPGHVIVMGKTSTVGSGYHIFVCDLLKRFGQDLRLAWDVPDEDGGDETGYFHTGDQSAVDAEMVRWLRSIVSVLKENLKKDCDWMMVSMPLGYHYQHHGPLVTPLGPRDLSWLDAVAADPRRGIDLFPWWEPGLGASFYLGRALCRMWKDVRWRKPLLDEEGELLTQIHFDLVRAYRLDPNLTYPWREWRELMDYLEAHYGYVETEGEEDVEADVARHAAATPERPLIGYRRKPVRLDLTGGWSIEIPGAMAEQWDEHGTWSAWDGQRTVWFTSYTLEKKNDEPPTAVESLEGSLLPEGERIEHRGDRVIGRAVLAPYEEDGEKLWQLSARSAVAGGLVVCNIYIKNLADRDWAISTWQSLDHP